MDSVQQLMDLSPPNRGPLMLYEVFIPSTESEGYDVTITVEAKNWMSARNKPGQQQKLCEISLMRLRVTN